MNLTQLAPLAKGGLESLVENKDLLYRAGKVAGNGFAKIADKLLDRLEGAGGNTNGCCNHHGQPPRALSAGVERLTIELQKFDTNEDGILSQEELTKGVESLNSQIEGLRTDGIQGEEIKQLHQLNTLKFVANGALRSYDKLSSLDDERGISTGDIQKLAAQDGMTNSVSIRDFAQLYGNKTV